MSHDFGYYRIISEIGRGGMGIVYQAEDSRDGRIVAIKQLVLTNIDPGKEQEFRDRFKREAATAQRLEHPNIVKVLDVSTDSENYFYVMEHLQGRSLRSELELKGDRLTPMDFWPVLAQVVEGLSFAHSMNVVHRDVKPDNIFILNDGTVKVTDFGIARVAEFEETHLTKTGVMMGTLAYVSPEQLQDAKNVDHRADIFSLGVVTYESLAGQVPFSGDGIAQTIVKIVSQEEKPLHVLLPFINVETSACVSRALRKKARDRYRSVKDFARDYEASLAHEEEIANVAMAKTNPSNRQASQIAARSLPPENAGPQPALVGSGHSVSRGSAMSVKEQTPAAEQLKPLQIFDRQGKAQIQLVEPAAICYRGGKVIVADAATRLAHMFSYEGRWLADLTCRPEDKDSVTCGGSITKPSGIAFDNKGRIYICDSSDPYIRIFDNRGIFVKEICNIQGKDGGIQSIALDSTGLIYVSDIANSCIQVFQSDLGVWMRKIGTRGMADGQFSLPAGVATDRLNQLYCTDFGSSRISIFNRSQQLVRCFGAKGTAPGCFNLPRSVAVDKNDKIYVLDALNHRVQIFDPTGNFLSAFGGRGGEPGQFMGPSDLSIDPNADLLYVADKGNHRIQVFELCPK